MAKTAPNNPLSEDTFCSLEAAAPPPPPVAAEIATTTVERMEQR